MKKFDDLVIGFGKGGKTLAAKLSKQGRNVALVEKSSKMYGGTCINIACIPTKALEFESRLSNHEGGDFAEKSARYAEAIA